MTSAQLAATMPTNADLGHAIRRIRQVRQLSIDGLGVRAGMHPTYLPAIERGQRNPSWAKLCDLAGPLGCSVNALVRAAEGEAYGAMHVPSADPAPRRAA